MATLYLSDGTVYGVAHLLRLNGCAHRSSFIFSKQDKMKDHWPSLGAWIHLSAKWCPANNTPITTFHCRSDLNDSKLHYTNNDCVCLYAEMILLLSPSPSFSLSSLLSLFVLAQREWAVLCFKLLFFFSPPLTSCFVLFHCSRVLRHRCAQLFWFN